MKRPAALLAFASAFALVLLIAGCAVNVPPPKTAAGSAAGAAPPDAATVEKGWANVLSRYVDDTGRIDFVGVSKDRAELDAYVAWIGRVSPANTPRWHDQTVNRWCCS